MHFLFPAHGAVLTGWDGEVRDGGLHTSVRLASFPGDMVTVNGCTAKEVRPGEFETPICLDGYRNLLEASSADGESAVAAVTYLAHAAGKYRLSLDDNIWFLRDIAQNRYASLFDNPYMAMLRRLHEKYGTKVHINIYEQCEGFHLSDMPDTYKGEWQANAHWLRLAFHARQNDPDMPYKEVGYAQMRRDALAVMREIRRFAGDALISPVTDIHWGFCTKEGVRALRAIGLRGLTSYFVLDDTGKPYVSMHMNAEQVRAFDGRSFMRDETEDILFNRSGIILNDGVLADIEPALASMVSDRARCPFLELLIHEQYFYPFYERYLPDFEARLETAVRFASERGFTPAFVSEVALEDGMTY